MSHPQYKHKGDRLGKFIEECGEALAAAGKTVRFGWDSFNPEPDATSETNEQWLMREIDDLKESIEMLEISRGWRSGDSTEGKVLGLRGRPLTKGGQL